MPSPWFSELMDMGYASYFPMILAVTLFYFFCRYAEFERASFVLIAAFFIYYVVFVALPVTGPQYYYPAVGMEKIAMGVFPNVGDYFNLHSERLTRSRLCQRHLLPVGGACARRWRTPNSSLPK